MDTNIRNRVLVTGVDGTVGKAVFIALRNAGVDAIGTVRCNTRKVALLDYSSYIELLDLDASTDMERILEGVGTVVHCAGKNRQPRWNSRSRRSIDYKINVEGSKRLVQASLNSGVDRFIYLSSVKVHGEYTNGDEVYSLNSVYNPQSYYARDKVSVEKFLIEHGTRFRKGYAILRPVNIISTRLESLSSSLVRRLLGFFPLPFGAIRSLRSTLKIETLTDIILIYVSLEERLCDVLLVADPEKINVKYYFELLSEKGVKIRLFHLPIWILRITIVIFLGRRRSYSILESLEVDNRMCSELLLKHRRLLTKIEK